MSAPASRASADAAAKVMADYPATVDTICPPAQRNLLSELLEIAWLRGQTAGFTEANAIVKEAQS
jgi:hypothetical protein